MMLGISTAITAPRVVTGGGFTPLTPSSVVAYWKISDTDPSSILDVSGGARTVYDQSSNGLNLEQSTASDQPSTGGTIGTNAIHALDFDGGDFMGVARVQAQPFTFATIAQSSVTGTIQALFSFNASGTGEEFGYWNSDQYRIDAGTPQLLGTTNTNPHVMLVEFNGATSRIYIDGTLIGTVDAGTTGAVQFRLGIRGTGFQGWQGAVSDTAIYGAILSAGDRASLTSYLGDLAGISVS